MEKLNFRSQGTFLIMSLALGLFSCSDKTTKDQQSELVKEQLGLLQPAAGKYSGALSSAADGTSLGNIQITLTPDTVAQTSNDGAGTSQRAVFKGVIIYNLSNNSPVSAAFALGDYDASTHIFKTTFDVTDQAGGKHSLDVSGAINDNRFEGTIEADNLDMYRANFSLQKNTGIAPANPRANYSRRLLDWSVASQNFVAQYKWDDGTTSSVTMSIQQNNTDANQILLNILNPKHWESVDINFGFYVFHFPSSVTYLDDELHKLQGSCQISNSTSSGTSTVSNPIQENLFCTQNTTTGGFACTLAGRTTVTLQFEPVKN